MSLLIAANVKNIHRLAAMHFIFLKRCLRPNLKVFQYKIWTSVKNVRKYLSSKSSFPTFMRLKLLYLQEDCKKSLRILKIGKRFKFEGVYGKLATKNFFNPIQDGLFWGCSWMAGALFAPLPKIHHTHTTMKLDKIILYLREIQKMYKSHDTSLESC